MFPSLARRKFDFNVFRSVLVQVIGTRTGRGATSLLQLWGDRQGPWISEVRAIRAVAIIDALTAEERRTPYLIDLPQVRRRVSLDVGVAQAEVLQMVEWFDAFSALFQQYSRMGFVARVRFLLDQLRHELGMEERPRPDHSGSRK